MGPRNRHAASVSSLTRVHSWSNLRHVFSPDLMTTREVADAFGVTTREIARRVERSALEPAVKLRGLRGAFLFNRADIAALTSERES